MNLIFLLLASLCATTKAWHCITKKVAAAGDLSLLKNKILSNSFNISIGFLSIAVGAPSGCFASVNLHGTVTLSPEVSPPTGENVALYLTVREDIGIWRSQVLSVKKPPGKIFKIYLALDFIIE